MAITKLRWRGRVACVTLGLAAVWGTYAMTRPDDEVVLTIGESYEQVRQQSHSTLPEAGSGMFWGGFVSRPARFRFDDPQFGFITPAAKFLYVSVGDHRNVRSVTLSPQIETLPLDETMAILLDLQDQLRRGEWRQIRAAGHPPITDTPAMRARMRNNDAPQTFWLAGDKYQVFLSVRRFVHENRPDDERYLITVQLGPPVMSG